MLDVAMGKERVRVWPRKRGAAKTAEAKALQDTFREYSWACKYWDPRNIVAVDQLRKGTPVLIRDLQMMMMYNRFANFAMSDGTRIFSVQARQDVSDSLDSICPLPGAMLIRQADGWRYVVPASGAGLALVSGTNNDPTWASVGGSDSLYPLDSPNFSGGAWVNQGTAALLTNSDGTLTMSAAKDSSDQVRGYFKALPAAPYSIIIGFLPSLAGVSFQQVGIALRESSSGKLILNGAYRDAGGSGNTGPAYTVMRYNSPTSKSANVIVQGRPDGNGPVYISITDDGTTRKTGFGTNPYTQPFALVSESRTAFGTPNQIGIYTANLNTTNNAAASVFSWAG